LSAARPRERFPSAARVRLRSEYLAIQNRGRRVSGPNLLLFVQPGSGRIGVTVSKKVGGAVIRNRVKRWIRECYRRRRGELPSELDLVVVARPAAAGAGHQVLCRELTTLAGRLAGGPAAGPRGRTDGQRAPGRAKEGARKA
jgi:ribonuclease P protein component